MIDTIRRHPIAAGLLGFFLLVTMFSSIIVMTETNQAVISRFGKPVRILGAERAGINWRLPFAESTILIDKRVRDLDMDKQQVLSTDQRRLEVDAFARYRVVDPLRLFLAARTVEQAEQQLKPILGSQLRNELGKRPFASLLSPEREGAMENIRTGLNRLARQYGVEIVDVRIKKADLPSGTPLESAYERMRTARQQEARSIEAEGQKRAQIIRAEADAEAARIYAAAFGKDPQFYSFYRAMQSYQTTFLPNAQGKGGETNIILSPNNEYLKEFTGR
ncbi:MAG TPA: protease modulator HflC [Sphingomicrobium sp.]|nr:protease modulator HflC [Sphingomicrobium sp.]